VTEYVYWDNEFIGVNGTPQPGVLGLVTITWAPLPVAQADRLDRQIDYDGTGPGGAFPTLWCDSFDTVTNTPFDLRTSGTAPSRRTADRWRRGVS
jgi:hypothetical protein